MTHPEPDPPRRRRARYHGTHPRRFEQRYKELDPSRFPDLQQHVRRQGRTPAGTHVPVLLSEVLEILQPQPGTVALDCTLGHGGHAAALLERLAPGGVLIGLDLDAAELERTQQRLTPLAEAHRVRLILRATHFAGALRVLAEQQFDLPDAPPIGALQPDMLQPDMLLADVLLADLGVSSMQLDDPQRGFSYKQDGPLDMRMGRRAQRTAAQWLAALSAEDLSRALDELADEPDHARIAAALVRARLQAPLERTRQLADLVQRVKLQRGATPEDEATRTHPAARTFQALRMLVNDERGSLLELLRIAPQCLRPGGRLAIISFHSGEDRAVKQALRLGRDRGVFDAICEDVIRASPRERVSNPRSAPARLRWARKAGGSQPA